MNKDELSGKMDATCRVALAAYLHDLGKFAERSGAFADDPRLEAHRTLYCPFHKKGGFHSHYHAAYTGLAFDAIEPFLPDVVRGKVFPFTSRQRAETLDGDPADSLVNAAAAHHKPESFLQWVIATADRVASGFEREEFEKYNAGRDETRSGLDHYCARQLTLFEQIRLDNTAIPQEGQLKWRYPLVPMTAQSIFPRLSSACEGKDRGKAKAEYRALWDSFLGELASIPVSHRANLPLWFDHFDSLWQTFTQAIPSATAFNVKPEVSLYDHSRTTAALAAALWRWHDAHRATDPEAATALARREDFAEQKFLLIQGDFFGIQEFIFASGGDTRRQAAKLLRGRSFQVSLYTELAALALLDRLGLPPVSQVINAAGKFMIVAPNTPGVLAELARIKEDFDHWFLDRTLGLVGIGLAWIPASCADFLGGAAQKDGERPFRILMKRLFEALERSKYQRFALAHEGGRIFDLEYPHGACRYNGRLPADRDGTTPSCALSRDQIAIGENLIRFKRLLVVRGAARDEVHDGGETHRLEADILGYTLAFTAAEEALDISNGAGSGRFGRLAAEGMLRRCWDYSAADEQDGALWHGYARRFIGGYVPRVQPGDPERMRDRYANADLDEDVRVGQLKPFDLLACEDRQPNPLGDAWTGIAALGILKGDVDDLGHIFRVGLEQPEQPSFAKWAALSRQMNAFFAIYLPWLLAREFPSAYVVYAGGDDFFLIGPWRTMQKLAVRLRNEFSSYVAGNPGIHFSVGIGTQKPGAPIHVAAGFAEEALKRAKQHDGKAAVTCFSETVPWTRWEALEGALERLEALREESGFGTAYVYSLLQFVDMRERELEGNVESALWRSRLAYRTRRFVTDKLRRLDDEQARRRHTEIMTDVGNAGIEKLARAYRIVLFNHLYARRER